MCSATNVADDCLDESDIKEVMKAAAASEDAASTKRRYAELLNPGSKYLDDIKNASAAKGAKAKTRLGIKGPVDLAKLKRLAQLKRCLPNVVGCTIQQVDDVNCYTAFYPGVKPRSRSRTWGKLVSKVACLRHVFDWAWAMHYLKTGQNCPFDSSKLRLLS